MTPVESRPWPRWSVVVRGSDERLQDHLARLIAESGSGGDDPADAGAAQLALAALVGLGALVAAGIPVDVVAWGRCRAPRPGRLRGR